MSKPDKNEIERRTKILMELESQYKGKITFTHGMPIPAFSPSDIEDDEMYGKKLEEMKRFVYYISKTPNYWERVDNLNKEKNKHDPKGGEYTGYMLYRGADCPVSWNDLMDDDEYNNSMGLASNIADKIKNKNDAQIRIMDSIRGRKEGKE